MQRRSSALRAADSLPLAPVHHQGVVLAVNGRECQVDCAGLVLKAVLAVHLPLVQPSQRVAVLQVEGAEPLVIAAWPEEHSSAEPLFEHDPKTGTLSINAARLKLAGVASVELACGDARLSISLDGRVQILGNEIVSAAVGAHRIEGASIDLN
jgi:hypothetical protein